LPDYGLAAAKNKLSVEIGAKVGLNGDNDFRPYDATPNNIFTTAVQSKTYTLYILPSKYSLVNYWKM
jgi:hypothetical protein